MIDRLLDFLTGREAQALDARTDELQLSVAALLIEAARMDSNFDAAERATIGRLLAERFDLPPESVQTLVEQRNRRFSTRPSTFPLPMRFANG
jgi:uncharacterized tellurite resistance protein B-like protein